MFHSAGSIMDQQPSQSWSDSPKKKKKKKKWLYQVVVDLLYMVLWILDITPNSLWICFSKFYYLFLFQWTPVHVYLLLGWEMPLVLAVPCLIIAAVAGGSLLVQYIWKIDSLFPFLTHHECGPSFAHQCTGLIFLRKHHGWTRHHCGWLRLGESHRYTTRWEWGTSY
jgi:hypothetical protein